MTRARNEIVDPSVTPYYHCISRCVRRAFLCGFDKLTRKNFDHRKTWVVERLALLSHTFAMDVFAYAVMSNHLHCLVRINTQEANEWSEAEVITRWKKIYSIPYLVEEYQKGNCNAAQSRQAQRTIETWRERLSSLSWFMRCLNEHIARLANQEDECTGRFWEGRFKSQALLDEGAVLTCMSYIDLNPIRAKVTDQLETSDFTSIQQRLKESALKKIKRKGVTKKTTKSKQNIKDSTQAPSLVKLMPLLPLNKDTHPTALGIISKDYFELVDWAGRCVKQGKRGKIDDDVPPILERLELDPYEFILRLSEKQRKPLIESPIALGALHHLKAFAKKLGAKFIRNQGIVASLYRVST